MPGPNPHGILPEQLHLINNCNSESHRTNNSFLGHCGYERNQCRSTFLNCTNQVISCICPKCKETNAPQKILPGRHYVRPCNPSKGYRNYSPPRKQDAEVEATWRSQTDSLFSQTPYGLVSWICANKFDFDCTCILCRYRFVEKKEIFTCQPANDDTDEVDC